MMKLKGVSVRYVLLALAMMMIAAACSGSDESESETTGGGTDPVTLRVTVWTGSDAHLGTLNAIADRYTAEHPNVTVQYDTIPFPEYVSKLTVRLSGSNPPDLGWVVESASAQFIEAGVLADLTDALVGNEDYNFDDFASDPLGLFQTDTGLYGIPFSTSPFIIFFNRDMFDAAGLETPDVLAERGEWTWEALATAAAAISAATPDGVYGFESHDNAVFEDNPWATLIPLLRAYGAEAWTGDQCGWDSPESIAALTLFHDMTFSTGGAVPPGVVADFFAGNSGIRISQISRGSLLEDAGFAWDIAPMPSGPAGDISAAGQAAFAAFNAGRNKEIAVDFVRHLTTEESLTELAQYFPPIRESVLTSGALANANPSIPADRINDVVVPAVMNGRLLPTHADFSKVNLATVAGMDAVFSPDSDIAASAAAMCADVDAVLQAGN